MNKTHCAALAFAPFLFAGMAFAGPLVLFPTGNFAFTVDITYPPPTASAASTPPRSGADVIAGREPVRIEVAQFEKEKGIRITWTDGQTTEQWTIPNLPVVFKIYPNGVVFPEGNGSMEHNIDPFHLPTNPAAFNWIKPACLKEKDPVNYKGEMCYHYVGTVGLPSVVASHGVQETVSIPVKREAWIDSTTLLPVALNTGDSFCDFTYQPPPTGPLNVPDNFQKAIANYKHVMGYP